MKLILDGSIQARIDSHNRVLLAQVLTCCYFTISHYHVEIYRTWTNAARLLPAQWKCRGYTAGELELSSYVLPFSKPTLVLRFKHKSENVCAEESFFVSVPGEGAARAWQLQQCAPVKIHVSGIGDPHNLLNSSSEWYCPKMTLQH